MKKFFSKILPKFSSNVGSTLISFLPLLIVGGLAILLKHYFDKIFDRFTGDDEDHKQQQKQETQQQKKQIEVVETEVEKNRIVQSYTNSDYQQIANAIYNACNHYLYEDDTAFYNELKKVKNLKDWQLLFVAFGVRQVDYLFFKSDKMNLTGYINQYLDNTHKYLLNQYYAKIGVPTV